MNEKEFHDELDELDLTVGHVRNIRDRKQPRRKNSAAVAAARTRFVRDQDDTTGAFKFTYKAARFEEWWLLDSLGSFYEHQWIADVLARVKGGKEANVYRCRSGAAIGSPYAAAKVYRPRSMRNLKNDQLYREGRLNLDMDGHPVLKDRDLRAIHRKTEYGRDLLHQSWITYELSTLETLHAAGADVPEPYATAPNALLMGFVGDGDSAAPALSEVTLERSEATYLFERTIRNVDVMLSHGLIHGDLSAYNILYWEGEITLIDFPQVVQPDANANSWPIFRRDVIRVCDYFAKQGVRAEGKRLAEQIWRSHGHSVKQEIHPRFLDAENPVDRALWERQQRTR
jgi:RIO kinase 1